MTEKAELIILIKMKSDVSTFADRRRNGASPGLFYTMSNCQRVLITTCVSVGIFPRYRKIAKQHPISGDRT